MVGLDEIENEITAFLDFKITSALIRYFILKLVLFHLEI